MENYGKAPMGLKYTIYTQVVDGIQETIFTDDVKTAMDARANGKYVLVGFSFNHGRKF